VRQRRGEACRFGRADRSPLTGGSDPAASKAPSRRRNLHLARPMNRWIDESTVLGLPMTSIDRLRSKSGWRNWSVIDARRRCAHNAAGWALNCTRHEIRYRWASRRCLQQLLFCPARLTGIGRQIAAIQAIDITRTRCWRAARHIGKDRCIAGFLIGAAVRSRRLAPDFPCRGCMEGTLRLQCSATPRCQGLERLNEARKNLATAG